MIVYMMISRFIRRASSSLVIFAFQSGDVHFTVTYGRFPITTSRLFNPSCVTFWPESYRKRRSGNLFTASTLRFKISFLSFLFFFQSLPSPKIPISLSSRFFHPIRSNSPVSFYRNSTLT